MDAPAPAMDESAASGSAPRTEVALGPVQIVVASFPDGGDIPAALARVVTSLRGDATVRLVDALVIEKDAAGRLQRVTPEPGHPLAALCVALPAVGDAIWHLLTGEPGEDTSETVVLVSSGQVGLDLDAVEAIAARLEPDTTSLVVLVEHRWAGELARHVRAAHGLSVVDGVLEPETMLVAGPDLAHAAAAVNACAAAEARRGDALIDALAHDDDPQAALAARVVRGLVDAGMSDRAHLRDAVDALVVRGLLCGEAVGRALEDTD
jgi:hypothetical protein